MTASPVIVGSVVAFGHSFAEIERVFVGMPEIAGARRVVVDNAQSSELQQKVTAAGYTYVNAKANVGYGAAHNLAFAQARRMGADYFLVLNPDIWMAAGGIAKMLAYMEEHPAVGQLMPDICNVDGSRQWLCKLLPTPADLILRRFIPDSAWKQQQIGEYELRQWRHDDDAIIPFLSGCFMLLRAAAFAECGGFDPRFFMYMEDADLCRRIGDRWQTRFFPHVKVVHGYQKGSYRNRRLLLYHIQSAIKYFNKWGWAIDPVRRQRNTQTLLQPGFSNKVRTTGSGRFT